MSKYRLVVFDWEGTLADTLGPVITILQSEAKRLNNQSFDESTARQYLMLGLVVAIKKILPSLTLSQHEGLLQTIQQALSGRSQEVHLVPGAEKLLSQIKNCGIELAIATNKGNQSLHRALQQLGLETYFSITRSAGQAPPKPSPQMLEEIMDFCGVDREHTLMIGDSPTDIEMAKAAGVDAVGVDFSHQSDQRSAMTLAGALTVVESFDDVAKFLNLAAKK